MRTTFLLLLAAACAGGPAPSKPGRVGPSDGSDGSDGASDGSDGGADGMGGSDGASDGADGGSDGMGGADGADGSDGGAEEDADRDGFPAGEDCDDALAARNPAATDIVGDDIDQNCDGVDGTDMDGDGAASAASGGPDCDDRDPARAPGLDDPAGDGVDSDCDGADGPAAAAECPCGPDAVQAALDAGPVDLAAGSSVAGDPLLTESSAVAWDQVDGVPGDLADGDADTLAGLACAAEELAVQTGAGWACAPLADLRGCPAGTAAVAGGCVELAERGTGDWLSAAQACDALGRRLCRAEELILGCALGLTTDPLDDYEWAGDGAAARSAVQATFSSCTQTNAQLMTTSAAYRCCVGT